MLRTGERENTGIIIPHPSHNGRAVAQAIAEQVGFINPVIRRERDRSSEQFPIVHRIFDYRRLKGLSVGDETWVDPDVTIKEEYGDLNEFYPGLKGLKGRFWITVTSGVSLEDVEEAEKKMRIPKRSWLQRAVSGIIGKLIGSEQYVQL